MQASWVAWSHLVVSVLSGGWCHRRDKPSLLCLVTDPGQARRSSRAPSRRRARLPRPRHPLRVMTAAAAIRMIKVMASSPPEPFDVVVVGAGPAGVVAALRAARLGAKTALVTRDQFGGMAANDGPVPVRTLAQAARLIREARQLSLYGIVAGEPSLDYARLLARVRDVTEDARQHTLLRDDLEQAGVSIYEQAGTARFADAHTVESDNAPRLESGQGHSLRLRCLAAAARSRLRLDRDAQRRVAPFLGAAVADRDRCWRDRRAGGIDLQRVRLTGLSRRDSSPHPDERGRGGLRSGHCRPGGVRRPGGRGRRDDRPLRALCGRACGSSIRQAGSRASTPPSRWLRPDGLPLPPG